MKRFLLLLVLLGGGCVAAHAQDAATPPASEPAPDQPIPFSHKKHVQVAKAACGDCHVPTKSGASLSLPQASTCMLCHSAIATDKPDIQRLAAIAKSGDPLPWVRVYQVPSFVQFSHKVHTTNGKTCQECHGPVGERDVIAKETDISMGGCIACHTKNNAPTTCDTCHQLEAGLRPRNPHADPDALLLARLGLLQSPVANGSVAAHSSWLAESGTPAGSPLSRYLGTLAMLPLGR
jgi:hypothetical protein